MNIPTAVEFFTQREMLLASGAASDFSGWPPSLVALAQAHDHEAMTRIDEATRALALAEPGNDPAWAHIHALTELRIAFRRSTWDGLDAVLGRVTALIEVLEASERPTAARGWYLAALIHLRRHHADQAEAALSQALSLVEDAPMRLWILDAFGQAFAAVGAFEEARRTFERLATVKRGDDLGVAISRAHLVQLEVDLGLLADAEAHARAALADAGDRLVPPVRARLLALLVIAEVEQKKAPSPARETLSAIVAELGQHPVRGSVELALARSATDKAERTRWLDAAERSFATPEDLAAVAYWRAVFAENDIDVASAMNSARALIANAEWVTGAELNIHLLDAKHARLRGDGDGQRDALDRAYARATLSNNPVLLKRVDDYAQEHDGARHLASVILRFTGGTVDELPRVLETDASIVFVDLVGFTPRSVKMSAADVMHTVRCLFELTVPVLAVHRVQPLSYRGDGLLACARGPDHEQRALAFAKEFAVRSTRVTQVRLALGDDWGLDVRGGVAAGPVVFGTLGSLAKLEFVVNGFVANFAARLQGQAQPNQVVCDARVGAAANLPLATESLTLKGIAEPVNVHRVSVSAT